IPPKRTSVRVIFFVIFSGTLITKKSPTKSNSRTMLRLWKRENYASSQSARKPFYLMVFVLFVHTSVLHMKFHHTRFLLQRFLNTTKIHSYSYHIHLLMDI